MLGKVRGSRKWQKIGFLGITMGAKGYLRLRLGMVRGSKEWKNVGI